MYKYKILFLGVIIFSSIFAQWEGDQRLTNTPTSTFLASNNAWNVAASGDSVHVVFMEYNNGSSFIHYTHSYNGGVDWSVPIMLSQDTCSLLFYSIATSGSYVHVAWADKWNRKIIYCRSVNSGVTWSTPVVAVNPGVYNVDNPCLAVQANNVYLTWTHNPSGGYNNEIYFQRSSDNGANWSASQRLTNTATNIFNKNPSLAASGNCVHLVWQRGPDYDARVMYMRSTNNGTSWETEQYITSDTINQLQPCIAASGNYVHIAWNDMRTETLQVFYRYSTDNGANWQPEKNLSHGFSADYQTIAAIGRNVHLAWRDYRFNQQWHIGYRCSHDNGQTWSDDTTLYHFAQQEGPSIAVAGTKVHLIWNDNRDGNWEIYYKRNPTGSGIEEEARSKLQEIKSIEIFPNPASSFFVVRYPSSVNKITLYDISGKVVKEIPLSALNAKTITIPLDEMKNGIYFVSGQNKRNTLIQKVTVVK